LQNEDVSLVGRQSFNEARFILDRLIHHNHEAYFVGGAVRDYLLGKEVKDIDIATSATPGEVTALFSKTIPVGVKHGTVIVRHRYESYEVTTFRADAEYEDFRRPSSVTFISSLHEDLKRRDFTVNAIAMSASGDIIDPLSGYSDLQKGVIRSVGDPFKRFREDPLRIMRALRFLSTYSFQLENNTERAISVMAPYLSHIAVERIRSEFEKLLQGSNPNLALSLLLKMNIHNDLPGMSHKAAELERFINIHVTKLHLLREHWALLCFVLQTKDCRAFLKKWKLPNRTITDITGIVNQLPVVLKQGWNKTSLFRLGFERSLSVERLRSLLSEENVDSNLKKVKALFNEIPITDRKQLAVNGSDLIALIKKEQGPWIAELLKKIENAVIHGEVKNEKGAIQTWLKKENLL
jgi:tRNA nucleotidyltransferase (CCA-adding enzyme)